MARSKKRVGSGGVKRKAKKAKKASKKTAAASAKKKKKKKKADSSSRTSKTSTKKKTKRATKSSKKKSTSKSPRRSSVTRPAKKAAARSTTSHDDFRESDFRESDSRKSDPRKSDPRKSDPWKIVKVGFHLGNCRTVVAASKNGDTMRLKKDIFPHVVGYLRVGALPKENANLDIFFAEEAFKHRRQLDLRRPVRAGVVTDVKVCRQFATHISSAVNPTGGERLWGVISAPAGATAAEWEANRRGMGGLLEKAVIIPEPRLAAEGMHLEKAYRREALNEELTRRSLVIDIGSASTDICVVHGDSLWDDDHVSIQRGGYSIDEAILANSLIRYPTLRMTRVIATEIKEEQAFVSDADGQAPESTAITNSELVALTGVIHRACDELLAAVLEATCELLSRQAPEIITLVSRNIILTGGGSRIRNLPTRLEQLLQENGFADARILVPHEYKRLMARGALRLAEKLTEEEWEELAAYEPKAPRDEEYSLLRINPEMASTRTRTEVSHGEADSDRSESVALRSHAQPQAERVEPVEQQVEQVEAELVEEVRPVEPRKEEGAKRNRVLEDLEALEFFKGL